MTTAQIQPKLSAQWQDWLAQNAARGCLDQDMVRVMVESGFEAGFAGAAVAVVRSMTERVQAQSPGLLAGVLVDPMRLPNGSVVAAHDRDVTVAFRLASPNIALLENLLSDDECEELIALSRGKLSRSQVVDSDGGGFAVSDVRTSAGTHFARGENALVARLEARLGALTGVATENGEPLQILHYEGGGEYRPHHDYFNAQDPGAAAVLERGGQRIATVVIFLNDVRAGGETEFPELELAIAPRRGCAVYFEYLSTSGQLDSRCLHAGRPVLEGEKWVATKWLRQRTY